MSIVKTVTVSLLLLTIVRSLIISRLKVIVLFLLQAVLSIHCQDTPMDN